MTSFRAAVLDDAEAVARLHAESWCRHYRGAYADAYLDGDVVTDRRSVWSARLTEQAAAHTVLAEDPTGLAGFVHVRFDVDDLWGSLVDNLHVTHRRQRGGIGSALLTHAATAVAGHAARGAMHVWVLEQNTPAQRFYRALGGRRGELVPVPPPGGDPARLNGSPGMIRFGWPDVSALGAV